jgi:hypothetical protein
MGNGIARGEEVEPLNPARSRGELQGIGFGFGFLAILH